jgi:hypothetical protein
LLFKGGIEMRLLRPKASTLAILVAIFALQMIRGPQAAAAQNPPNVTNEARALAQFAKGLGDFQSLADTLKAKASRSASDISLLESSASRLKGSTSSFRSSLDAFIKKHKDAGLWNPQLDSAIESKLDSELKDFARQNGGARRLFELGLSEVSNLNAEIDQTTSAIKGLRVGALGRDHEFVAVAYASPLKPRGKCIALFVVSAVSAVAGFDLGETEANAAFKKNKCGSNATPTT